MTSISKLYEPSPKFGHGAAAVRGRCYLWGGRVHDFSESSRKKLASTVEIFDPYLETWEKHHTTGVPPPGLYFGACTSLLDSLYWFGGGDGSSVYNSLHKLDPTTLEWRELQPLNQADRPMRKYGCEMVSFLQDQLATFGGNGISVGPTQPGAMFTKNTDSTNGSGWSNELHVFDITKGKWSSPPMTGPRPPPRNSFSFTAINNHQAVLFGGRQPHGRVSDCYLMNFESMEWTKLERPEGAPWPVDRSSHAACCLNFGEEHPQLLVTGGVDKNGNTLGDAWILDVKSGRWRELTLPKGVQPRMWHTATALNLEPGRTQVTMFGGCQKWEKGKSDKAQQKLAKTTVVQFELVELTSSGDGTPTREWILVGMADSNQLGSPKRLAELEKMKQRKTEHEREREIKELKETACQLEEEKLSSQKQTRLALARAVSAEIEADQVAVLKQQLAQTKTNLEQQVHMKDQARIAAEQQLQQTKAALEHEIHMKDKVKQKLLILHQQAYELKESLEHQTDTNKQAMVSAQQQFNHQMKALEHQIEVREQARVALELQIQAKDREKTVLEQQLHRIEKHIQTKDKELEQCLCLKEEQIQTKDREKAELKQHLRLKEEQIRTKNREKAELEQHLHLKEEQIRTKDMEKAELEQHLRQKEEQIRTKDKEKAELEQHLHQKEEQIRTKDKEKAELEQHLHQKGEQIQTKHRKKTELEHQLHQTEEYGPPEVMTQLTLVAEMQQKESGHATAQGDIPIVHQLLQAREEVRTKEEEPRQVREEHEAELSRLKSTAKQQEIEFELKIRNRDEEICILQSQINSLQHDRDDLQQQLRERDIQIASISGESQNRIEIVTADREELSSQMHILEAKFKEVEFFRDHYSQEVDQLREELMNRILEIESLRKQLKDVVPAGVFPTTSPADKVEVKHQNVQTKFLEMKDQNTQTKIVQIKDQQVQAESTEQLQAGFGEVELNDQQIQTETVQPAEPHVETGNVTQQQGGSDKVEVKDELTKIETMGQQVQGGKTVYQQEYLRGFETFAETSLTISDSHSHSFEWQRYGLKLHIPEGAVPVELTECKIDIKVCLAGQFSIPDDLQLVSCIYWLRGPQRPFLKPVTLEIEHCASLQDSSQSESLQFVVAKCSQPELPYQFRVLEKGTFVPQSSYGSIQVSQFSLFGITIFRRSSRPPQYYSALFYIQKGLNWWDVDFVITMNLKGSWKAIEDSYSRLDAIFGPRFMVQFESDTIRLDISEEGICGWTITPLIPPVIDKQQVHRFKPQQEVPYCRLEVKLDKDKKPTDLKHKVKLQGAKSPRDFFTITCPPGECVERPKDVTDEQRKYFGGSKQGVLKKIPFSDVADTPILSPVAADNAPSSGSTTSSPRDLGSKYAGLKCVDSPTGVTNGQGTHDHFGGSEQGVMKKRHFSDDTHTPSPVAIDDDGLFSTRCGSPTPSPRDSSSEKVIQEGTTLGIEDLADITSYLHQLDKTTVFNLGLVLSLNYNRLKFMMDSQTFLHDMLAGWLEKVDQVLHTGAPTWKRLVEALKDPRVGQNGLASKIEQEKN